eukprot:scaffold66238_cov43-Cyclotella_meneghiniana.AAC.2
MAHRVRNRSVTDCKKEPPRIRGRLMLGAGCSSYRRRDVLSQFVLPMNEMRQDLTKQPSQIRRPWFDGGSLCAADG